MKISFVSKQVEAYFIDEKIATRQFGSRVTTKLYQAVHYLQVVDHLSHVQGLPMYRLHALKGNRQGQYAMDLGRTSGFRLIFIPLNPKDEGYTSTHEATLFKECEHIMIQEVSHHYE